MNNWVDRVGRTWWAVWALPLNERRIVLQALPFWPAVVIILRLARSLTLTRLLGRQGIGARFAAFDPLVAEPR